MHDQGPLFSKDVLPDDFAGPGGHAWAEFRKTTLTKALKIDGPFRVTTIHGGDPQACFDGWLALDSAGHPYPIDSSVFDATFEPAAGATTRKPSAGELLEKLSEYVEKQESGSVAIGYNKDRDGSRWLVSVVFGREAPDSDMAGGAAHGLSEDLGEALAHAAGECGLL